MRGGVAGGAVPSVRSEIDYVNIQTTGNATNFGDCTVNRAYIGGCSDSHGGLG